jgi:uncharacterized membrane protein
MKNNRTRRTVLTALFAALIFLGIFIIKIPIAATGGYIHFGDGFIYIASSILPLPFAAAAAAVGGALADMLAGYIAYAPWTAVIKALMGIVGAHSGGAGMAVLATVIAGIINIAGYFVVECFMYSVPAAFAGVPMNCLQSAFGVVIFFILAPAFSRALHVLRQ